MAKKGFVQLLPLLVVTVVTIGSLAAISARQEQKQKEAVGKVLSSSDSGGGDSGGGSSTGSSGSSGSSSNTNQSTGTSNVKIESRTPQNTTKVETKPTKTKIEVRNPQGRFETEIKDNKQEIKIRTEWLRIERKLEGDKVTTKVKNEKDEEVEVEDELENELLERAENKLEDRGIKIATRSAQIGFIQNGHKIRTNFPLSVNAATGELFVSTPAGEKVVAILPSVAIQNMIRAGIMTRVEEESEPDASPEPSAPAATDSAGEGTPSASVAGAGIELTQVNNKVVYVISGVKSQRFLGFLPVDIRLKTVVSAEDSSLIDIQEGFFGKVLDILSF